MSVKSNSNVPLYILMVNMFIAMLGIGLIIPVLPQYMLEFGASGSTLGYLVAAFGLTQFIFSPLAGELSDKYGRKIMIVSGLVLFTVSQWIFGIADEIGMLYLSRLLGGIGASLMIPSMMAYVADITNEQNRGKGMGWLGAAMSLGFVIGPGLGGFLAGYGLRVPFYTSAGVAALATIASLLILPETLSKQSQLEARQSKNKRESMFRQLVQSVKAPYFILLILVFSLTFGLANFEAIFGLYVDIKYQYTAQDISILITVGALMGVIIQALVINRLLQRYGEKLLINLCFLLSALCLILMLFSGNFWYVMIITLIFFAVTSILRPAINTMLSKMAGDEQGFVAGMNNAYMSLGNIIGPSLAGILFDVHINLPYTFGALILLFSLFLSLAWERSSQKRKLQSTVQKNRPLGEG
ncbi:MFS transporter [Brevibacillus fulvus]|uniref:DHA1 family multidrug resistance protein-like MFS transporter n=1 Tax=Brevibacillus fulvus TaxID=1125967 RepID=A0A938XY36_9BACL|nr:MFS transporter [Brevibacillus fulvus]MBM7590304.1 DHA1 family multidrug resistance protein-like MFS transporter [Brevibacillus fulvus]